MFNSKISKLSWINKYLEQTHKSNYSTLIVSGCSFTDSTSNYTMPVSWPGYLKERCGIDHVINLAMSGGGNEYISTSILNQIECMSTDELKNCMCLIMWSGIDRKENLLYDQSLPNLAGYIDNVQFIRKQWSNNKVENNIAQGETLRSWKNIMLMQNYLKNKNIAFGFSFYINVFYPPFLPRRDKTVEFPGLLNPDKIQQLINCQWVHPHQDSLFEWCFYNDKNNKYFEPDLFHPSPDGYLAWTDNILIPNLVKMKLVTPI